MSPESTSEGHCHTGGAQCRTSAPSPVVPVSEAALTEGEHFPGDLREALVRNPTKREYSDFKLSCSFWPPIPTDP